MFFLDQPLQVDARNSAVTERKTHTYWGGLVSSDCCAIEIAKSAQKILQKLLTTLRAWNMVRAFSRPSVG
jgi:hypothetical protein